jgi:hypothetical protein
VEKDEKYFEDKEVGKGTQKKYKEVLKQLKETKEEFKEFKETWNLLQNNKEEVIILPKESSEISEATAVAVISDWHVEEEVRSGPAIKNNRYNLEIAKKRSEKFFQKTVSLIKKEQQGVKITNLLIPILGDMITARPHEENLETCLLLPADAILYAETLLVSGIKFILAQTDLQITIVCHVGNHPRITKKVHHATETGNSLETLLYHALAQNFKLEPRVKFQIASEYHSFMKVYDTKIRFHHGHKINYNGGVGGLTIPVNKAIAQWNKINPVDLDIFGHFHTYMSMKNFIANGSLIGYNAFALSIKADWDVPRQAFFLIDKKHGVSVNIPIILDDK